MNRSGQLKRGEFINRLADWHGLYIRIALLKADSEWQLHSLVADHKWPSSISPPFTWTKPQFFDYGTVGFVQGKIDGNQISSWIEKSTGFLPDARIQFKLPGIASNADFHFLRLPGHARYYFKSVPWAHTFFRCNLNPPYRQADDDLLVSMTLPSFPGIKSAFYHYLHEREEPDPTDDLTATSGLFFREAHAAWIKEVKIAPSSVEVSVDGIGADLRVEVGKPPAILKEKPSQAGTTRFGFENGLPSKILVVLSANGDWLDYRRNIDSHWSPFTVQKDGVAFEPPDLETSIRHWCSLGEGPELEYKEKRPDKNQPDKERITFIKSFAAFANGNGGVILIGVNKEGDLVGQSGNVGDEKDAITSMIRSQVFPEPNIRLEDSIVDGKEIIVGFVEKGNMKPYGVRTGDYYNYYVRRGATTFLARPEEVRSVAREDTSGTLNPLAGYAIKE